MSFWWDSNAGNVVRMAPVRPERSLQPVVAEVRCRQHPHARMHVKRGSDSIDIVGICCHEGRKVAMRAVRSVLK